MGGTESTEYTAVGLHWCQAWGGVQVPPAKPSPVNTVGQSAFCFCSFGTQGEKHVGVPAPFAQSHHLCGRVAHPGPHCALCAHVDFHLSKICTKIKLGNPSSVLIFSRISCALLFRGSLKTFPQNPGFPSAPYIMQVMAQASADLGEAYIKTQSGLCLPSSFKQHHIIFVLSRTLPISRCYIPWWYLDQGQLLALPTGCRLKLWRVVQHWSSPGCRWLWSQQWAAAPEDVFDAGKSHSPLLPSLSQYVSVLHPSFIPFYSSDAPFVHLPFSKQRMLVLGILWVLGILCLLPTALSEAQGGQWNSWELHNKDQTQITAHNKILQTTFPAMGLVSHMKIQLTCFQTIHVFNCYKY